MIWKRCLKVGGKAVDDLGAPALVSLTLQNVPANLPVKEDHLPIGSESRLDLGSADTRFNFVKEARVACGQSTRIALCDRCHFALVLQLGAQFTFGQGWLLSSARRILTP